MAVTSSIRGERRRVRSGSGEAIVLASMATVAAVIGAALVLQLGTPVWAATCIAAMFLAAVLAAHVLVRRSEQLAVLEREMAHLDARLDRVAAAGPQLEMPPLRTVAAPQRSEAQQGRQSPMPGPLGAPALVTVPSPRPAQQHHTSMPAPSTEAHGPALRVQSSEPTLRATMPLATVSSAGVRIEPVGVAAPSPSAIEIPRVDELPPSLPLPAPPPAVSHRAEIPAHPPATDARPVVLAPPAPVAHAGGMPFQQVTPIAAAAVVDVEPNPSIDALLAETAPRPPIDDLLKRLAGDISAGAALRDVRTAPGSAPWIAAEGTPDEPLADLADFAHETVTQADVLDAESPEAIAAQGKVAAIVEALSNERIDLVLEPIIGFETLAPEHYDVTVRLRHADGAPLVEADYAEAARGTGLLALIDTVKIARTKRLVTQTMADGRERVLNVVEAETLSSEQFHEDIAELTGADAALAGRLVLTFRQSDVRGFAPVEWQALARLSAIGFRFGVDAITDLDMDFAELAAGGFTFARLDADVFLDGLMVTGGERVSPADVCRHLTESGLGLVVRRIDDPKRLARVMGFGVMMGQGAMFGPPRVVSGDAEARPRHDA